MADVEHGPTEAMTEQEARDVEKLVRAVRASDDVALALLACVTLGWRAVRGLARSTAVEARLYHACREAADACGVTLDP